MSILNKAGYKMKLISLALFLLALGYVILLSITQNKYLPAVETGEVILGSIEEVVNAPGEIQSERVETVNAGANGTVKMLGVSPQEVVKQGELICVLRPMEYADNSLKIDQALAKNSVSELRMIFSKSYNETAQLLESAELEARSAREKYEQYKQLYKEGAIPKQQLTDLEIGYKRASFSYNSATNSFKNMINNYRIVAPFTGTLIELKIDEGKKVQAGEELFTVADMNKVIIKVKVDETDINKISAGQKVNIGGEFYNGLILEAVVERISGSILNNFSDNPGPVAGMEVICRVNGGHDRIALGMKVTAQIILSQKEHTIIIPTSAVLINKNRKYVYVLDKNRVFFTPIEIGLANNNFVEVTAGLKAGQKVITQGNLELTDRMRVRVQ